MLKKLLKRYLKKGKFEVSGGHNLYTDKNGNLCISYFVYVAGIKIFEDRKILFRAGANRLQQHKEKSQFKNK